MAQASRKSFITWIKIIGVIVAVVSIKSGYDYLASEGHPFETLLFKIRAPYASEAFLKSVKPTSFRVVRNTDTMTLSTESESFKVDYKYSYPQLEYYGDVVERAPLNRLISDHFKGVEHSVLEAFKKDAEKRLADKELTPGFGTQPANLEIIGDVSYFSKSIFSIKYKIKWSYGGEKEVYPTYQRAGYVVDIQLSRPLELRDILAYPYKEYIVRLWDLVRDELAFRNVDPNTVSLYGKEPEFYVSPVGLVVVNLSTQPAYQDLEIKVPFKENRLLFRREGPVGHLVSPAKERP
ncbi:hypothetical protein EBR96_05950 [bacterium]|nr:hypothetical protein [bacterium]